MNLNVLFFVISLLICAYDVNVAIRSGGHNAVAWILAAIMAGVALFSLTQLVRRPNP